MPVAVEIFRSSERFTTRDEGRLTRHSFSFGTHYDPENVGFGPLVCHDDHRLRGGAGFEDHSHADVEIVTWVIDGAVEHADAAGNTGVIRPGTVQVQSAGAGIVHREAAATGVGPTRFVQAWLTPDQRGAEPAYDTAFVTLPDEPRQHVFVTRGALVRSSLAEPLSDGDAFRITDQPRLEVTAAVPTELLVWTFTS